MTRMMRVDELSGADLTTAQQIDALATAVAALGAVLGTVPISPDKVLAACNSVGAVMRFDRDGMVMVPVDDGKPEPDPLTEVNEALRRRREHD